MKHGYALLIVNAVALFAATSSSIGTLAAPLAVQLPAETAKLRPSSLPGYGLALQKCGICHSADYIAFQPPGLTMSQWTAEVRKMRDTYGAPIEDRDVTQIGAYLAVAYGSAKVDDADVAGVAGSSQPSAGPATDAKALLTRNGCLGCHSIEQKIVGPAYQEVAARYRTDPQARSKLESSIKGGSSGKWGTASMPPFQGLSKQEVQALVEFVLAQ